MSGVSYPYSTRIQTWALVKSKLSWSILVKTLFGTEFCDASVRGLFSASIDAYTGTNIICKANRYNKLFLHIIFCVPVLWLSCWTFRGSINWPQLPSHRLIKPILWDLYFPTYLLNKFQKSQPIRHLYDGYSFKGVVSSHGVTHKWYFSDFSH